MLKKLVFEITAVLLDESLRQSEIVNLCDPQRIADQTLVIAKALQINALGIARHRSAEEQCLADGIALRHCYVLKALCTVFVRQTSVKLMYMFVLLLHICAALYVKNGSVIAILMFSLCYRS